MGLEGVRPMGRKLIFLRPVDFAKISRSSLLGYKGGCFPVGKCGAFPLIAQ